MEQCHANTVGEAKDPSQAHTAPFGKPKTHAFRHHPNETQPQAPSPRVTPPNSTTVDSTHLNQWPGPVEKSHSINTMRFFHKTKPSARMHSVDSCQTRQKIPGDQGPRPQTEREPRPNKTTPDHMCPRPPEQSYTNSAGTPHPALLHPTTTHSRLHRTHCKKKNSTDPEDVKKHAENFPSSKPAKFYADGTFKPPDRWTKATKNNRSHSTEQSSLKHHPLLHCKLEKKMPRNFWTTYNYATGLYLNQI